MAVLEITKPEDLRNMMESGNPLLVMFSADWCGDCKVLTPIFENEMYVKELEKAGITVVKMVLSREKERVGDGMKARYETLGHLALKNEFSSHGLPTVVFFRGKRAIASTLIEDLDAGETDAAFKTFIAHVHVLEYYRQMEHAKAKPTVISAPSGSSSRESDHLSSADYMSRRAIRTLEQSIAGKQAFGRGVHQRFRERQPISV